MRFGQATAIALSHWRRLIISSNPSQQAALFSSAEKNNTPSSRALWPLRVLKVAGASVGVAIAAVPVGAAGALILSGHRSDADAHTSEMFGSLPRTLRVLWWSIWAAYNYKTLAAAFAASTITEEDYRLELVDLHRRAARRLLRVCQKNGGVYVKAGQLTVSMQAAPPEYRQELEGLQDRCLPRPFAAIDRVLVAELGAPASELFDEFDPKATAAASLAQVHRAVLKDGTTVAVKVQYPGLQSAVAADLTAITAIAALAAWLFPSRDWRWLFSELRSKLTAELDFRHEAANAARLAACFAGRDDVAVPAIVPQMCSSKVLTMEWIDGAKVSDADALRCRGLAPRQVGLALLDITAEMMCVHGYVHGDLHPGNVFVRALPQRGHPLLRWLLPWRRRAAPQIVFLDHGVYFELPAPMRQLYCQLWCAFVLNDSATARDVATQLAGERAGRALPEVLRPRDWSKMGAEERRRLQRRTGVTGIADLGRLLSEAPRALLDCLRASAVVRHTATRLGATAADRLRVNATQALHGLQVEEEEVGDDEGSVVPEDEGQPRRRRRRRVQYVGAMRSQWRRWNLWLRIQAMKVAAWVSLVVGGGREFATVPLVEETPRDAE